MKYIKGLKPLLVSSLVLAGLVGGSTVASHANTTNTPNPVSFNSNKPSTLTQQPTNNTNYGVYSNDQPQTNSNKPKKNTQNSESRLVNDVENPDYQDIYNYYNQAYNPDIANMAVQNAKDIDAKYNNSRYAGYKSNFLKHHDHFYVNHHYGAKYGTWFYNHRHGHHYYYIDHHSYAKTGRRSLRHGRHALKVNGLNDSDKLPAFNRIKTHKRSLRHRAKELYDDESIYHVSRSLRGATKHRVRARSIGYPIILTHAYKIRVHGRKILVGEFRHNHKRYFFTKPETPRDEKLSKRARKHIRRMRHNHKHNHRHSHRRNHRSHFEF